MRTLSTKVHDGTVEEVEEYQEREGIDSRSEALRRLIRAGLEEESGGASPDPLVLGATVVGGVAALQALAGSVHPAIGVVGLLASIGGVLYSRI